MSSGSPTITEKQAALQSEVVLNEYRSSSLYFLNSYFKKVSALQIANLQDTLEQNSMHLEKSRFFPERSNDGFYIQYENRALAGKKVIYANLMSQNLESPNLSQDALVVALQENPNQPGVFTTRKLVLVSNQSFDHYGRGDLADNQPRDPTVMAQLGGAIIVAFSNPISGRDETAVAQVPVKKVMQVQPFFLRDAQGKLLASEKQLKNKLAQMQESLAPAGIQLEVLPAKIIELPPRIKLEDGLSERELKKIAKDTAKIYPSDQGLRLIMVGEVPLLQGAAYGTSYTKKFKRLRLKEENAVFLTNSTPARTPGHEASHCLIDSVLTEDKKAHMALGQSPTIGYHHESPFNLMSQTASTHVRTLWGSEHLTDEQIETMLQSPLLQDPILQDRKESVQFTQQPTPKLSQL